MQRNVKKFLKRKKKTQKTWVRRCSLSSRFLHWRMGTIQCTGRSPRAPQWAYAYAGVHLAPRMLDMHSNVLVGLGRHTRGQCVQVQATRSNPLSSLMGSDTFPEPNTRQIIFLEPHAGLSIFYIDQISIILNRI